MAIVYFDSSALVKLVVEEDGSESAAALWDGADAVVSSRLAYPEVRAALAAAARTDRLSARAHGRAKADWDEFWGGIRAVEVSPRLALDAGRLAEAHRLRGYDAVHLASALTLHESSPIVAVWDETLRRGAIEAGLEVAPQDP